MAPRTSVGLYLAVTDRTPYPLPALPTLGPAGSSFVDPTFGSTITRLTDGNTRPDAPNCSFRTPSSPHSLAWSCDGKWFWLTSTDGTILVLSTTGGPTARPSSYIEPQFSFVQPGVLYLARQRTLLETCNVATLNYAPLLDMTAIGAVAQTYIGFVSSSAAPERVSVLCGGTQQDKHYLVAVLDPLNPMTGLLVVNTVASTVNGQPTNIPLSYHLHHACIDRSGRYVMLYPTSADMTSTRKAPQSVLWDTQAGTFTELPETAYSSGHDALGYAQSVNQDAQGTWDADQWQIRQLATPLAPRNELPSVLTPKEIYIDGHECWNNATPDGSAPFFTELYQYGLQIAAGVWRAWDDEIIALAIDGSTAWRFCHHRSDVRSDNNLLNTGFWYQPRVNVSIDGKWALFTSNWGKTLGTDPNPGDPTITFRQDVFLLRLDAPAAVTLPTLADVAALLAQAQTAIGALQASGVK